MGLEAATDEQRNPYLDLIRVLAIAAVVVGHWIASGVTYRHGEFDGVDVLGVVSWTSWLTLIFQVVPLFFLVGGYSNALSWSRHQAVGGSAFAWSRRRVLRLLVPTAAYVAVMSLAVVLCNVAGANHADLQQAAWALSLHLWFLAVYLVLLLLTPALLAAHRRFGVKGLAATTALAVVIDIGVIEEHWHVVGWVNYVLVWGTFHQLGFAWYTGVFEGTATGRRGRPIAMTAGAISALVVLIWWGPYPVSMVGVPGARIQNASPPSAALLAFGFAQVGLVVIAAPAATRWLTRPDRTRVRTLIGRANAMTMPVYLWHMVPVVIVSVVAYPNHLLAQPSIGSGAWWAQRIGWIAMLSVVLGAVLALVVTAARVRFTQPVSFALPLGAATTLFGIGVGVSVAALGRLAVQGFAPNGSFDIVTVSGFALGTALVALTRPRTLVRQSPHEQPTATGQSPPSAASTPQVVVAGRLGVAEPRTPAPPSGAS